MYSLYGNQGNISLVQLKIENSESCLLLARAENSGCEGCYVEVAKWNERNKRWERYAFEKYFGGEHPSEADDQWVHACTTAEKFARDINAAAYHAGENCSFIHSLPDYESAGEAYKVEQAHAGRPLIGTPS